MWHYFKRNSRGLRDTYHYIRVIQKEKNGSDFNNFFQSSINEISYRSLLCQSQVKKYVKALIELGLVERKVIRKANPDNNSKPFESTALYKVKYLTDEVIAKANEKKDLAEISLYVRNYKQNQGEVNYEKRK